MASLHLQQRRIVGGPENQRRRCAALNRGVFWGASKGPSVDPILSTKWNSLYVGRRGKSAAALGRQWSDQGRNWFNFRPEDHAGEVPWQMHVSSNRLGLSLPFFRAGRFSRNRCKHVRRLTTARALSEMEI